LEAREEEVDLGSLQSFGQWRIRKDPADRIMRNDAHPAGDGSAESL
jgi:hypothetical protein